ncbi:MAG: BamA/TamA family outer membrane protein, partial [Candidatus Krumholzibacteriota bacterium]|nr:BamA/TamA family outer membrane protein [Candidatus Krumholzibacteriota bacterium]
GGIYFTWPIGPDWAVSAGAAVDRNVPGVGALERSVRQRYRLGVERTGGLSVFRLHVEGAHKRNHLVAGGSTGEGQFLARAEAAGPVPIGWGRLLHLRVLGEGVFASGLIEPAERYPLGGATTLRGYRENQFRGERIALFSAEYRLTGDGRVFLFDDAGAFFVEGEGWTAKNGAGFGLRSDSPLGVIELSFGVGERLSLDDTRIHISLRQSF